jgi:hypothetical protein
MLSPKPRPPIPADTAWIARAAFPKGLFGVKTPSDTGYRARPPRGRTRGSVHRAHRAA